MFPSLRPKGASEGQAEAGGWSRGSLNKEGGLGWTPESGRGWESSWEGPADCAEPTRCPLPAHPFISAAPSSLVLP